ncbi:hypothetical protein CANCADRAFT_107199 [Tortispora caseinolytica NRRL Y-17796]|uniref:Actin-related protein 2/3 complex subunit n=1 Tax=Tortispora caseinolytica NRRL Y-17796 TaxID=767744 RepID=A0A1E4TFP6_9ASCO|nr:hypothetical protein CANCADRAFT_107199 [Tortispora caseinolytica NRRL Y-17796]
MPQIHQLGHSSIADFAFSANKDLLAVPRASNVELYNNFKLSHTLTEHDKTVTGLDISPSGRIVTCSQDRNALVWDRDASGEWKPSLVLLRINRAATSVRWSPDERKFAVGSGARLIAVCYFEEENDWWVSKHIKKPLHSTVLNIDWHPNSVLLAAASTDGYARVFSAYIKGVDERPAPTAWGERIPFQTLCGEFTNETGSWVHDVAFSPSGDSLAYCAHDASVTVVYPSAPEQPPRAVINVKTDILPFKTLTWVSETSLVAAGFACHPVIFSGNENGWKQERSLDDPETSSKTTTGDSSALSMFRRLDLKGSDQSDSVLPTIHQNTITVVRPFESSGGKVTKICTAGIDGKIVIFAI